ncbi:DUF3231 family protein [Priestia megaterium]|uniref:DUF3231 family protein n=1 Tax=Priestia megaterium TaxID=1404 RepID=UPI0018696749|nr:DUF3231 family protein [Priestia megaterium]MBE2973193.1 DUF3231 family protein [Priestia megaterium]
MDNQTSRLTSSEITSLWTQYIQDTMSVCISKYVLAKVKDPEVYSLFEFTLELAEKHLHVLRDIFKAEKLDLPIGFTDKDVNLDAPPLFTDTFWLVYIHEMTMHGLAGYSISFSVSAREDIRDHYYQCNIDAMDLYNKSIEILISKGIYQRSPYFSKTERGHSITEWGYVMDLFGDKRQLNSMEAGNIYFNLKKSIAAKALVNGFKQVTKDKDIHSFMDECLHTASKNINIFSSLLQEENLQSPRLLDAEITNSDVTPFSDKLMVFHAGFLFHLATTYYAAAMITSMRIDIVGHCDASILRDLKTISSFGRIMIKKRWIEKLPQADDRKELS